MHPPSFEHGASLLETLPCPLQGQGSILVMHTHAPFWRTKGRLGSIVLAHRHHSAAPAARIWRTKEFCPALREGRAASCTHQRTTRTHHGPDAQFSALPSTRAGQPPGSVMGQKSTKIQFNSIPHQIESRPTKPISPQIQSKQSPHHHSKAQEQARIRIFI